MDRSTGFGAPLRRAAFPMGNPCCNEHVDERCIVQNSTFATDRTQITPANEGCGTDKPVASIDVPAFVTLLIQGG